MKSYKNVHYTVFFDYRNFLIAYIVYILYTIAYFNCSKDPYILNMRHIIYESGQSKLIGWNILVMGQNEIVLIPFKNWAYRLSVYLSFVRMFFTFAGVRDILALLTQHEKLSAIVELQFIYRYRKCSISFTK